MFFQKIGKFALNIEQRQLDDQEILIKSVADSSDGRAGDCGSKGPRFKPRQGPSLRIGK